MRDYGTGEFYCCQNSRWRWLDDDLHKELVPVECCAQHTPMLKLVFRSSGVELSNDLSHVLEEDYLLFIRNLRYVTCGSQRATEHDRKSKISRCAPSHM